MGLFLGVADRSLVHAFPTEDEVDDVIASIARYGRQSWEWLESQPLPKLSRMSMAIGRLLRGENGKRDPLDLRASSEENR